MILTNNVTGRFVIDLASIKNTSLAGDPNQPVLIAHLLSDDFFGAKRFPTATFQILWAGHPLTQCRRSR